MTTSAAQAQTNAGYLIERHPPPSTCPPDGDAPAPMTPKEAGRGAREGRPAAVDKKSAEYLVKSLVAGGMAGCAVRASLKLEWKAPD